MMKKASRIKQLETHLDYATTLVHDDMKRRQAFYRSTKVCFLEKKKDTELPKFLLVAGFPITFGE